MWKSEGVSFRCFHCRAALREGYPLRESMFGILSAPVLLRASMYNVCSSAVEPQCQSERYQYAQLL